MVNEKVQTSLENILKYLNSLYEDPDDEDDVIVFNFLKELYQFGKFCKDNEISISNCQYELPDLTRNIAETIADMSLSIAIGISHLEISYNDEMNILKLGIIALKAMNNWPVYLGDLDIPLINRKDKEHCLLDEYIQKDILINKYSKLYDNNIASLIKSSSSYHEFDLLNEYEYEYAYEYATLYLVRWI